jgi:hypothetical protein
MQTISLAISIERSFEEPGLLSDVTQLCPDLGARGISDLVQTTR